MVLTMGKDDVKEQNIEKIKEFLRSGNGSQVSVRLRRQSRNYQVSGRWLFRRKKMEMGLVPPVTKRQTIILYFMEKSGIAA